jgi:uncharacterized protein YcbK (DUF882 family)
MKTTKDLFTAIFHHHNGRRGFLKAGLAVAATGCLFPSKVFAAVTKIFSCEKRLSFHNTHTGENLHTIYCELGAFVPQALSNINYILRDFRTGDVKQIDTNLLDLLFTLQQKLKTSEPFHIISGYRSPATNSFLRMEGHGVAAHSLHLEGKAIDIRLPGCDLKTLHCAAVELRMGGVGYYPGPDFVHVDVGRVRYW